MIFAILFLLIFDMVTSDAAFSTTNGFILYVINGGEGECGSWSDACGLQSALLKANIGDQIWVSAGKYKPTVSTDRKSTFNLKSGVSIYGGFPADGGEWDERDWETHITIMSGDIGVPGDSTDNSYHVVTGNNVDETAVLDGFIISDGRADGPAPHDGGAGMNNQNGNPTLSNLIFINNYAAGEGGGMNNYYSNPTLSHVTFRENTAIESGGGMNNRYSDNPILHDILFTDNLAIGDTYYSGGGGMANHASNPEIYNVTFSRNRASDSSGGGIFNSASSPTIENVILEHNSAIHGGGVYNVDSNNPSITNSFFFENTADFGGGIATIRSNVTLNSVTFFGNFAGYGGGIEINYSNPNLVNVTFSDNSADYGAAMRISYSSSPVLTNVSISGNTSRQHGGGIYNEWFNDGNPVIRNTILWGNIPDQINGNLTAEYSIIQGGYDGVEIIDLDPLLDDLQDNGGFTWTHGIRAGSPAIDSGNSTYCPNYDQRFYVRPVDGDMDGEAICDIGAFEFGSVWDGYTLTTETIGNGSVSINPQKSGYHYGETVTLTGIPADNWSFEGWSGLITGTDNPVTIKFTSNVNIRAHFKQVFFQYYLPLIKLD